MGRDIQLFSGYSQKENRTTNYCLLILKLLYDESPKYLGQVLSKLIDDFTGNIVGVKFNQQSKDKNRIPDGVITQDSFKIFIETKNFDWFYDEQLKDNLKDLNEHSSSTKILFALSNFEKNTSDKFESISKLCNTEYRDKIIFKAISFNDLIIAIESIPLLPVNLTDIISDFRSYLDEENLLPDWENWLDVINCSTSTESILKNNIYVCPASGGSYNHMRCKYFGMYSGNKIVDKVSEIEAVIDWNSIDDCKILWKNIKKDDKTIKDIVRVKLSDYKYVNFPLRTFVLGELISTKFKKTSSGGLFGSKMYFDLREIEIKDSKELAEFLNKITWDEFLTKYHTKYHVE